MEWKHKVISLTGMWLASLVGAVYGLLFTIIGAGFNWGPGGGMEGPYWKILIVGVISLLIGMYAGEFIVRRMSAMVFRRKRERLESSMLMFIVCAVGSIIAWLLSWETGYIAGILTETISWDEPIRWSGIILDIALMSTLLGIPFAFGAGIINGLVAWFVLKK
jgi:hypothetical protein